MRWLRNPSILIAFLLVLACVSACTSASEQGDANRTTVSGETLFHVKTCYTCHTIGKGPLVGPDLKGLFQRRSETWVKSFIADPSAMVKSDSQAQELKSQYPTQMPKLNLSQEEIDALVAYLKTATQ